MRARWNETTWTILAELLSGGNATVREISKSIKSEEGNVSTILLRLYRAGHVERESIQSGQVVIDREEGVSRPKYVYSYSITKRGEGRLGYIASQKKGRRPSRVAANPKKDNR